jgi:glycosyltransferase involved in cell wall biosynthesis
LKYFTASWGKTGLIYLEKPERPMRTRKIKLAFLLTHPIQYQSPLLKRIATEPDIELTVFYQSDCSIGRHFDEGFGCAMAWDSPLLEGYAYRFLPSIGRRDLLTYIKPLSHGLWRSLKAGKYDAIIIHGYNRPFHWLTMLQAKILGVKVFIRDEATLRSKKRGFVKIVLKRAFFEILNFMVEGFLAIGTANATYYACNGIPEHRIFMTPYAVDNAFFSRHAGEAAEKKIGLRKALDLENGRPVVLYVGKLLERKRIFDLFDAFVDASISMSPKPYLFYIGDGELKSRLLRRIEALGNDAVRFLGFRNQKELPAFYALCDVFALTSSSETWGLVVNEAMNAGKAIIVSDHVGCGYDLVQNGANGFVVPCGDVGALAGRLEKVLTDRDLRKKMGGRSKELIAGWSYRESIKGIRKALGISTNSSTHS